MHTSLLAKKVFHEFPEKLEDRKMVLEYVISWSTTKHVSKIVNDGEVPEDCNADEMASFMAL